MPFRLGACLAALLVLSATAARAVPADDDHVDENGVLLMRIGERITFRLDAALHPVVASVANFDPAHPEAPAGKAAPDVIVVALASGPGSGAQLTIQNGLNSFLDYRAIEVMKDGAGQLSFAPTSTCTVPPGLVSYESWVEPVIGVALGPFLHPNDGAGCRIVPGPPPAP